MKPCIKCRAELPDSAGHCIYCGVGQPAAGPPPNKATMMGHPGLGKQLLQQEGVAAAAANVGLAPTMAAPNDANQVIEQARQQQQMRQRGKSQPVHYGGAQQQQAQFNGAPQGQQPYGNTPPQGQQPYGNTPPQGQQPYGGPPQGQQPYGGPPQGQQPYGNTPAQGQQPYGGPPQGQQQYGGPPQGQQPYGNTPPPGQQQYGGPPPGQQQYGGPPQGQQQYGGPQQQFGGQAQRQQSPFGGANLGVQDAQFGSAASQQQPYGIPGGGNYREALTEQVKPLRAPPSAGESEAWNESLTTQMLVFGVLLIACFVAPWAVGGEKTVFSWSVFSQEGVSWSQKLTPIMLAATGVVAVALGALKLSVTSRAFAATGIGLAPILYGIVNPFVWQSAVAAVGAVMLVSGLIVRSRFPEEKMGRIVATIGVLAILALYLIPNNGAMPVKGIVDSLSAFEGKAKLLPIIGMQSPVGLAGLVPLLLTLLGLLAWMKGPGKAGTSTLAWTILFWGLLASIVTLLVGADVIDTLKGGLSGVLYLPLANVAWMTLACFGIAGVLGSQLDN